AEPWHRACTTRGRFDRHGDTDTPRTSTATKRPSFAARPRASQGNRYGYPGCVVRRGRPLRGAARRAASVAGRAGLVTDHAGPTACRLDTALPQTRMPA